LNRFAVRSLVKIFPKWSGIGFRGLRPETLHQLSCGRFAKSIMPFLPPALPSVPSPDDPRLLAYLNLKLREIGQPGVALPETDGLSELVDHLLRTSREKDRALSQYLSPVDQRIQNFLLKNLEGTGDIPRLPATTLELDRPGLARALSLPPGKDEHRSSILTSYRVRQGVLHNPRSDRRTTQGIFHVAEGGLPVPDDKKAVPKAVFARLLARALQPSGELLRLPFTAAQPAQAECFVTLHLRPVVIPAVPGFSPERAMETRFFVPGSLVANLDFVESIFSNAGDPHLAENDAALDPEHWTGHTGCVVLAPHLNGLNKRELGLPEWDKATERQRRDGMCWRKPDEIYNDGGAFKLTSRDSSGVVVTLISDNYFGYCKKEVKTQISFAANLLGRAEEEHAGGAIVFPSYDLGEDFQLNRNLPDVTHTFAEALALLGDRAEIQPDGWARDRLFPSVFYVPETARFDLRTQRITWSDPADAAKTLKLLPGTTYVLPSGYKVEMAKVDESRHWRLRGTTAEGLLCHKPCTVSGGGKSEISKSIADAMFTGPVFVSDLARDLDAVEAILARDYHNRFRDPAHSQGRGRPILSPERSLGSVVKLLSRSPDYTDEYNAWLGTIPRSIRDLVLLLKRLYKPEWGNDWRQHFTVDTINARPGNELKHNNGKLLTHYLRVGYTREGGWRTFTLRSDFFPAEKLQVEDDITASAVAPRSQVPCLPAWVKEPSLKFVHNCELRLFQRPDDAVIRGYDKHTERDFSRPGHFFSNYEPLSHGVARTVVDDTLGFEAFTSPMQKTFLEFLAAGKPDFLVSPAHPRIVDGKPSKNPRYLQDRLDLEDPRATYLAHTGARLYRRLAPDAPAVFPVGSVLMGRRLNPPEAGVRPLCVFGPIHYQELPEAFMDLIASLTGKSPSTTGAGSEGALTKGPFNALPPIYDLNAALVSFILTGLPIFSTAAGWVGPRHRVDHDISLLVPEIWCRMTPAEREVADLIKEGHLERCVDFDFNGKRVLASRLGWRITARFIQTFCGRVLGNPSSVFDEEFLKPETQDLATFADGVDNIVTAMRSAAAHYFSDGTVNIACPPLRALLHVMRDGMWEGIGPDDPKFRELFTRESMLASEWYAARLAAQQTADDALLERQASYLEKFLARANYADVAQRLDIRGRLARVINSGRAVRDPAYLEKLKGTIGVDPAIAGAS
jgi:phosphoenolpyruvate carboxykinase (diphosphate)